MAVHFGCCASQNIREDEVELRREVTEMQICYDQPRIVPPPRVEPEFPRPSTSHSMSRHISQWASRASVRTSSFSTIARPWTSQSKTRPSISGPTDFRRGDGLDIMVEDEPMPIRRRRSFRPLELSIYMPEGRLSPLPDFALSEWDKLPAELEMPAQALVRQATTASIPSNRSSYTIQRKPVGSGRSSVRSSISRPSSVLLSTTTEEPRVEYAPNTSIQRSSTQSSSLTSPSMRNVSRLPSPSRARSNTEPALTHSRRSSLRRAKTDVDEAIRELNTIVEETRRADALRSLNPSPAFSTRPPPSPSHHVPAIAPSLRMHVRSETLSDIGSAFSAPLVSKPLPNAPPTVIEDAIHQPTTHKQTKLRLVPAPSLIRANTAPGPLNSNPITPPTPTIPTPTTPIARLGAWLKRSLPSTPTTPSFSLRSSKRETTPPMPNLPFYQLKPVRTPLDSRPSSRSTAHLRQDSDDTATVTLVSYPSTPSLCSRTVSPEPCILTSPGSPETPGKEVAEKGPLAREVLKGQGRARGLTIDLGKAKEMGRGEQSIRVVRPAELENHGGVMVSPGRVGVAF